MMSMPTNTRTMVSKMTVLKLLKKHNKKTATTILKMKNPEMRN